jgi:glycosyltransferase involved in cell wall biosynthesis
MFSVVILTLNEERNLPACLASAAASNDIVVLDSGSSDSTVEIARAAGARVITRAFTDFAGQRNHAHETVRFENPWVFHLDADEMLTPALVQECTTIGSQNPASIDGYLAAPRMMYHGRWIPRCTDFPAYQARFTHVQRFRFVQIGHGQREAPGLRLGHLKSSYLHNLSAHTDHELENKHRRYAQQEATAFLSRPPPAEPLSSRLRSPDPLLRRRALKELSQRLPARATLRFLYQYVWRRGFLDGGPGLAYCLLLARYEGWISAEIQRQRRTR